MAQRFNYLAWLVVFVLFFSIFGFLPYAAEPQNISQQESRQQTPTYATPTDVELFDHLKENENYILLNEYSFAFDFEVFDNESYDKHWQEIEIDGCVNNFIPWEPRVPIPLWTGENLHRRACSDRSPLWPRGPSAHLRDRATR